MAAHHRYLLASVLTIGLGTLEALAQAPAVPKPADPVACSAAPSSDLRETIALAEGLFDSSWLAIGTTRVTFFRTKPEAINPLAPRDPKAEPPAPAITGFIHAASVGCAYFPAEADTAIWFIGSGVRFHETGKWSGALPQGLLMGVRVRRIDGALKAIVDPTTPTVVLPDAILSKPDPKDFTPPPAPISVKAKKR